MALGKAKHPSFVDMSPYVYLLKKSIAIVQ